MVRTSTVTAILGIALGLSELALFLRRHSAVAAEHADRGSLRTLWIVIMAAWVLAIFLANALAVGRYRVGPALFEISILLFAGGVILRWHAILYLGRLFTVDVAIAADHRLIDSGPYRRLRHPSYTGELLAFLGLGVLMGNVVALAVLLIPSTLAFLYRIRVEEAALQRALGQPYLDYMQRTYRLLPGAY